MAYAVTFKTSAVKQIKRLSKPVAERLLAKTDSLGQDPRPPGCLKLSGPSSLWRVRVGDYRIVYVIDDAGKKVDVRIIAHRREVY